MFVIMRVGRFLARFRTTHTFRLWSSASHVNRLLFVVGVLLCIGFLIRFATRANNALSSNDVVEEAQEEFKQQVCTEPRKHVAYLKVHKTGSTTLVNIFQRFAITNHLTVALPSDGCWYISFQDIFRRRYLIDIREDQEYEVLCQHTVYNRDQFKAILPWDSVYIGSLREPFSRFVSSFMFFQRYPANVVALSNLSGQHDVQFMEEYLKDPNKYEPDTYRPGSYALNRMAYDFGIPFDKMYDNEFTENYMNQLEHDFELVLIREFWDESLVLLKRVMCWTLKDILYHTIRVNRESDPPNIPDRIREMHRELAGVEYRLYDRFYKIFQERIVAQGPGFYNEVEWFRRHQASVVEFCKQFLVKLKPHGTVFVIPESEWGGRLEVTSEDCYYLGLIEIYLNKIIMKQQGSVKKARVEEMSNFRSEC